MFKIIKIAALTISLWVISLLTFQIFIHSPIPSVSKWTSNLYLQAIYAGAIIGLFFFLFTYIVIKIMDLIYRYNNGRS
jgi:hypothetical protein